MYNLINLASLGEEADETKTNEPLENVPTSIHFFLIENQKRRKISGSNAQPSELHLGIIHL